MASDNEKVRKVMHEFKHGTLRSYPTQKPVTNRKQAIAIALSEQRREQEGKYGNRR